MQIIFRKISDVKREEEELLRRKNEAPLDLPPDHPVRRLFQRFRQQREARLASQRLNQGVNQVVNQGATQGGASDVEKGASSSSSSSSSTHQVLASTSIIMVTESLATPTSTSSPSPRQATPAPPSSAPQSSEPPRPRGWGRLREAGSWSSVSKAESMEALAGRSRSQDHQGGAPLRKTDSCDSGITKSDLRLDSVGGARTPQEHSPIQSEAKRPFGGPIPEQGGHAPPPLPHHTTCCCSSSWQELRGDIGALGSRMAALETQLAEVLRLLRRPQDSDRDTFS